MRKLVATPAASGAPMERKIRIRGPQHDRATRWRAIEQASHEQRIDARRRRRRQALIRGRYDPVTGAAPSRKLVAAVSAVRVAACALSTTSRTTYRTAVTVIATDYCACQSLDSQELPNGALSYRYEKFEVSDSASAEMVV
jgi:hypothetical protein